jgi:transcriptional regulator with XRE-family HTH domain
MSMKLARTIGDSVRAARRRQGVTRAQVAEALSLPLAAYCRLEQGRLMPSVPTLLKLASLLAASVDGILGLPGQRAAHP